MNENAADFGKLVLRLTLGGLLILHGLAKLMGDGVTGIAGMLASHDLPGILAYGVYVGEIIAPLMIILGFFARIGAGLVVINMLVAIWLVHAHEILALTDHGGWAIELQAFYLFTALAILLIGSGRFAVRWDS